METVDLSKEITKVKTKNSH